MEGKSIRQKCEDANISTSTFFRYKNKYPGMTDDQIISYCINELKIQEKSFRQKCMDAKINYNSAREYKRRHKEIADDDIIKYYLNKSNISKNTAKNTQNTFKQKCEEAGINYKTLYYYRHRFKELTDEQIIAKYLNKEFKTTKYDIRKDSKPFKQKYIEAGITTPDYRTVIKYRKDNPDLSDEDVLRHYLNRELIKNNSLEQRCIRLGISSVAAIAYKERHRNLTDDQIIEHYLKKLKSDSKSFRQKCIEHNINYSSAISYRANHPELTDDDVVKYYINELNIFKQKCAAAGISYNAAAHYIRFNNGVTYDQAILKYNPYCYYNITGDFIIVPLPNNKGEDQR